MEKYEKPVMEIELFSEEEQEILTDTMPSGEALGKGKSDSLPTSIVNEEG